MIRILSDLAEAFFKMLYFRCRPNQENQQRYQVLSSLQLKASGLWVS